MPASDSPAPLNRMTELRAITFSPLTFEMLVMSDSVIPSAKYSSEGSRFRFSSGSTAIRSILRVAAACVALRRATSSTKR